MDELNLKCPCCESPLDHTHYGRYEDLSEHVSNPNGTPSLKRAWQCPNQECIAHNVFASWIDDGGIYIDPPEEYSWTEAHRLVEKSSKSGMYWALGSWEHYYNLGKREVEKRKRLYHIGKWRVEVTPKTRGGDDTATQYLPKRWGWKFDFWKKGSSDGYWEHVIPVHRMVKFCVGQFNRNYNSALYNPKMNSHSIKRCMEAIECYAWGRKDERNYAKISSWVIRTLMPGKVNIIRSLADSYQISHK